MPEKTAAKQSFLTTEEAVRVPKAIEQLFSLNKKEGIEAGEFLSGILARKGHDCTEAENRIIYQLVRLTEARKEVQKQKNMLETIHKSTSYIPGSIGLLYEGFVMSREESFKNDLKEVFLGKKVLREQLREELRKSKERSEVSGAIMDMIMGDRKEFTKAVDFLIKKTEEKSAEWAKINLAEGPYNPATQQKSVEGLTFTDAIDILKSLKTYVVERNDPPDRYLVVQDKDFQNKLQKLLVG